MTRAKGDHRHTVGELGPAGSVHEVFVKFQRHRNYGSMVSERTREQSFAVAIPSSATSDICEGKGRAITAFQYPGNKKYRSCAALKKAYSAYIIDDVSATLTEVPGSPFPAGNNPAFIAIL
jgi:hypothetical protein